MNGINWIGYNTRLGAIVFQVRVRINERERNRRISYLETGLVNVVATSSFAVDDFFLFGQEFHKANWTIALDGFSIGICRSIR